MIHVTYLLKSGLCRQFAAALLLCLIALAVVSAWFASGESQERALVAHRAKARAVVALMDRVASARLAANDFVTLAEQVIPGTDIKGGGVYDGKGYLVQAFGEMPGLSPRAYGALTMAEGARAQLNGDLYDVLWRFEDKGHAYFIAVRTDAARVLGERHAAFGAALIYALIAAFCTAFAFLAIAMSYWAAPLLALERAISAGNGRAIDETLTKREDEIGRLARAIRDGVRPADSRPVVSPPAPVDTQSTAGSRGERNSAV